MRFVIKIKEIKDHACLRIWGILEGFEVKGLEVKKDYCFLVFGTGFFYSKFVILEKEEWVILEVLTLPI